MILLLIIFSPLIYWILTFLIYERHLYKFPGPTPWPIIGNALEFGTTTKIMTTLARYRKKYNGNFRIYMGYDPMVVIIEPKAAEFFLTNTQLDKSRHYKFSYNWLRNGLLVSNGKYWKNRRRILTPAFHFNILKDYVKIFDTVSDVLIEKLKPKVNEIVDIFPLSKLTSLDIICEAAMGSSVNALKQSGSSYVKSVEEMGKVIIQRIFSALHSIDFIYKFTNTAKNEKKILRVIHNHSESIISTRKKEFASNNVSSKTKKKQAFLDLLLTYSMEGENLSERDIQEEVDTFMFAGHDTTATSFAFTLYCLSKNERVQNKIIEELDEIYKDDPNRPTTYQDLQDMKYLDLVLKESLRMFPSVPFHFRQVTEELSFNGITYPKGTTIMIYNLGMHLDENYFKNPHDFYPERFDSENDDVKTRGSFSYIPFSAGPRNCIGQRFAILQLKSSVSKVMRHFRLLPCKDHQLVLANETVMVSHTGTPVHLVARN
ncbi:cytochrome P450 4d2-like isoform X2 [Onthophagus taurus]|uniref:cytochrome P450 4d2-like isoform X2 n=1 Tax=Onthophagus taurus TaxID=166361 RepID=UPI0039BEC2DF